MTVILSRPEWGARPPNGRYNIFPNSKYAGIEAHHGGPGYAGLSLVDSLRKSQNFHLDSKGWTDIFYAFKIHSSGVIGEARGWNRAQGNQNTWRMANGMGYLMPVQFVGDFRDDPHGDGVELTQAAKDAWNYLHGLLLDRAPQAKEIRYHGQRAATACPGEKVERFVLSAEGRLGLLEHLGKVYETDKDIMANLPTPEEIAVDTNVRVRAIEQQLDALFKAAFNTQDTGAGGVVGPSANQIQEMFGRLRALTARVDALNRPVTVEAATDADALAAQLLSQISERLAGNQ